MRLTRRQVLAAGGASFGSSLIAATISPLRAEAIATGTFKTTTTTLFWVGEQSDAENDFIPNDASYWDRTWQTSFGGVDDPEHRDGHWPAGFRPRENPFYVALPYGEFVEESLLKLEARRVPWYRPGLSPLLKNRWVEIRLGDRSCFAQWEDVGPCGEDDFHYVFGMAPLPSNTFDARAGLDVSPAVWHHLGMTDNADTAWRFVEASEVMPGPWTEIITVSDNNR